VGLIVRVLLVALSAAIVMNVVDELVIHCFLVVVAMVRCWVVYLWVIRVVAVAMASISFLWW
jgi:hypothetical protein